MNVLPSHIEFVAITDAVIRIATLPNGQLRAQSMGEASLIKAITRSSASACGLSNR